MSTELQKKLYAMEVEPPAEVWQKLSLALDEINADNRIAGKIENAEVDPPTSFWKKISNALYGVKEIERTTRRAPVFSLKKLAAAAIIIGVLASGYFIFFNDQSSGTVAEAEPVVTTPATPNNASSAGTDNTENIQNEEKTQPATEIARGSEAPSSNPVVRSYQPNLNKLATPRKTGSVSPILVASATTQKPSMNKLEEKTFNQSLDDVSFVGSQQGYMTMVNADGRLVKIPEKYTVIAPYLQDKSDDNSLVDFLFGGEGEYWKDMFRQWRQKLAQSAITPSHDNFFDIISLLKTIQDNQ